MDSVIIVALIAAVVPALGSIVVQIMINNKQQKVSEVKLDFTIKSIEEHINRLEVKQDKHNNLIERMALAERDIKELKADIHDLMHN